MLFSIVYEVWQILRFILQNHIVRIPILYGCEDGVLYSETISLFWTSSVVESQLKIK